MTRKDPAQSTTSAPHIAARLEDEILLGNRFPRERLVEDQLMAEFSANRYETRKALQILVDRGLAERRKNAGAFVRSFTEREVHELYHLRILLETACIHAIQPPVEVKAIEHLKRIQREHDAAVAERCLRRVIDSNIRFHQELFRLSANRMLTAAVERYARMSYVIRSAPFKTDSALLRSQREHWQMIELLETGETDSLAKLCEQHLIPSRDMYLNNLF